MGEVHPYISEGFGEDFIPQNYDMSVIDHFEQVTDKDGAVMARRLAKEEGLFCGYSAGSVLQGLFQLKDRLKEGDLVVLILHDHGSRYVAKVYNDNWMKDRGFIETRNFASAIEILRSRPESQRLVSVESTSKVSEAVHLLHQAGISQIPVMENGDFVGSLSDTAILSRLMEEPEIKSTMVKDVMEAAFPIIDSHLTVEEMSAKMGKEVKALLVRDDAGDFQIITRSDLLMAVTG
jgi:cystathionine beta-synthase